MKTHIIFVAILLVTLVGAGQFSTSAQTTIECAGPFEASIYQGPDADTSFHGTLALTIEESGSTTGTFTLGDGTAVNVTGQIMGRAVSLVFDMGNDDFIFGTGASLNSFDGCNTYAGGPLVGPSGGSSGDWALGLGDYEVKVKQQKG